MVLVLLVACSGGETGAGITRAEVEEIVREQSASSQDGPGITRAQVEEIVREQSASSQDGPGITRAQVEEIVKAAIAGVPQFEDGSTKAEVEAAVRSAIAGLPQPEPGLTAAEAAGIARMVVAGIPPKSSPADYTKFFVNNAISRYESDGIAATLAYYNRVESVDGQWYVFIVDERDLVIAHPDGSLAGLDLKGPLGTDANGYNFGQEMLSAGDEGRWVSYVYRDPETRSIGTDFGELQLKNAWVVRHDGLLFGSGWYVDADEFTKSFVAAAVDKFRAVGLEGTVEYFTGSESDFAGLAAAIDYYNSIDTVEGEWSAFIVDGNGRIVDHHDKKLVGRDLEDLFGVAMFEASEEGNWVTTESLRIWVVSHNGLVFGSGWRNDESGG